MASSPSALTVSSIWSSGILPYTGSNTPIGILRMDLSAPRGRSAVWDLSDPPENSEPEFIAEEPGTAAASRVPPVAASKLPVVAARNCLRSTPALLRPLFIWFFPPRWANNLKPYCPRHYTPLSSERKISTQAKEDGRPVSHQPLGGAGSKPRAPAPVAD